MLLARLTSFVVACAAVAALSGCGDATGIRASFTNLDEFPTVYALNGTPQNAPSALNIRLAQAVPINPGFTFDLAFEFEPAGGVRIYTVRKIASQLIPVQRVGLQISDKTFDEIPRAPTSGYTYDSLVTVGVNKTVVVNVLSSDCAGALLGQNIYGMVRIDSLDLVKRAVYLHVRSNPNCGFRSLLTGIPKD